MFETALLATLFLLGVFLVASSIGTLLKNGFPLFQLLGFYGGCFLLGVFLLFISGNKLLTEQCSDAECAHCVSSENSSNQ